MTAEFVPLNIAVLTISDTRTEATDSSGDSLAAFATEAGHQVVARRLVKDDVEAMRAAVSEWIEDQRIQVVISTGGTGFSPRDSTPEAIMPLLEKPIDGFGELFRQLSYAEIGSSTVQSRAFAGLTGRTLVCCLPGSGNACRTAWQGILHEQLDSRHRPCNFAAYLTGD